MKNIYIKVVINSLPLHHSVLLSITFFRKSCRTSVSTFQAQGQSPVVFRGVIREFPVRSTPYPFPFTYHFLIWIVHFSYKCFTLYFLLSITNIFNIYWKLISFFTQFNTILYKDMKNDIHRNLKFTAVWRP